jgi:serine O-acetyltransferase
LTIVETLEGTDRVVNRAHLSGFDEGTVAGVRRLFALDREALVRRTGRSAPFVYPQLTVVGLYRLARFFRVRGHPRLAAASGGIAQLLTGAEVSPMAVIGPGFQVVHTYGVIVAATVVAGRNLTLYGGVVLGTTMVGVSPQLGDDVIIYAKASVLGPIRVGSGSRVGAHALCLTDVPAGAVAKGIPATSRSD